MILPRFEYSAAATPAEAISMIAGHGCKAEIMAGGTDIMVNMKRRVVAPDLIVSIHKLDQLRGFVQRAENQLRIGVLNTMHDIAASDPMTERFPALATAASGMGSPQIRNRATIGGNLVSSRPAADTIGPLIGYGAKVRLQGATDERLVAHSGCLHRGGGCHSVRILFVGHKAKAETQTDRYVTEIPDKDQKILQIARERVAITIWMSSLPG
jgi:CO/xanthine dehydrogenase FAD-binding subunit